MSDQESDNSRGGEGDWIDEIVADAISETPRPNESCVGDADIALAAEGRLPDDRRDAFERHVAVCADCRGALAFALRECSEPIGTASDRRAPRSIVRTILWPILIALALGALWIAKGFITTEPTSPSRSPTPAERIEKELAAIGWKFAPLAIDRLEKFEGDRLRADPGVRILPVGMILSPRPAPRIFGHSPSPAATLVLYDSEGRERMRWQNAAADFSWPADAPPLPNGLSILFVFRDESPLGPIESTAAARIATEEEAEKTRRAIGIIEASAPVAERDLWIAQTLLEHDMPAEALLRAESALRTTPDSVVAQKTRDAVRRVLLLE